jgi:hypothetical protein
MLYKDYYRECSVEKKFLAVSLKGLGAKINWLSVNRQLWLWFRRVETSARFFIRHSAVRDQCEIIYRDSSAWCRSEGVQCVSCNCKEVPLNQIIKSRTHYYSSRQPGIRDNTNHYTATLRDHFLAIVTAYFPKSNLITSDQRLQRLHYRYFP